jgi:hypothetical protein
LVRRKTAAGFGLAAVRLAVSSPGVLDAHFDAFRETQVGIPELYSTALQSRGEALASSALHAYSKI